MSVKKGFTPRSVGTPTCSNVKAVTKKVENNLSKNELNLPNHIHLMWQVDYTFSGGILTQAVSSGDRDHGGKVSSLEPCNSRLCSSAPALDL